MKLVFIYGPMAVGKLTVANEVVALTGYKNFHGHLSTDVFNDLFSWGSAPRVALVNRLREDVFETASRENIEGMVFTYVYDKDDDLWVKKVIDIIQKNGGQVYFVQLIADMETLFSRLTNPSREKYIKLKDVNKMKESHSKYDLFAQVNHINNLSIDNTNLSAKEVAKKIIEYIK